MEIIKTYTNMEEYLKETQQKLVEENKSKIDKLYENAVNTTIDKETIKEMINKAFKELGDSEAELSILEQLYLQGKVEQKEVINAKRRHTKAEKQLNNLYKTNKF